MDIEIDPKLKPLYANLLRIDLPSYLITSRFDHLLLEHNWDQVWNESEKYVRSISSALILIPGFTGYAEKALAMFLNHIFTNTTPKEGFYIIIKTILKDFLEWKQSKVDLTKTLDSISKLGIKEDKFEKTFFDLKKSKTQALELTDNKEIKFKSNMDKIDNKLLFVIMPLNDKFDSIYSEIIKKVVQTDFNLKIKRADEIFSTKPIIEDIWEHIRKSKYIIADLTGRNPNVFYELGIAHALNKKAILLTQDINDVPFDLKHIRCIVYEDSIAGSKQLEKGLKNTLEILLSENEV